MLPLTELLEHEDFHHRAGSTDGSLSDQKHTISRSLPGTCAADVGRPHAEGKEHARSLDLAG